MKKLAVLVLCVACLLCACGSTAPQTATVAPELPPAQTPEPTPEPTPAFEPVVIVETEDAKMTVTSVDPEIPFEFGDMKWTSYGINVLCENMTDKVVLFAIEDVSMNGFMIPIDWSEKVTPGAKVNSTIYIGDDKFIENGITELEKLNFKLLVMPEIEDRVYERDDAFVNDYFTFAP